MKIFIDCGSHSGNLTRKFLKKRKGYKVHMFEPNPEFNSLYGDIDAVIHKEAVWIEDTEMELALGTKNGLGSTLIKGKKRSVNYQDKIKVPCMDFSKWLMDNFTKDDYIVLKMNVEGAEYHILPKMFQDKSIDYIDELFGEIHRNKFKTHPKEETERILKLLKGKGLTFKKTSKL